MTNDNTEARLERLETIVAQVGKSVIASNEAVTRMAERVDALAVQIQHQNHQVQQQGYQIFALSDSLQNLVDGQSESRLQLYHLVKSLQELIKIIKQ